MLRVLLCGIIWGLGPLGKRGSLTRCGIEFRVKGPGVFGILWFGFRDQGHQAWRVLWRRDYGFGFLQSLGKPYNYNPKPLNPKPRNRMCSEGLGMVLSILGQKCLIPKPKHTHIRESLYKRGWPMHLALRPVSRGFVR